MWKGIHRVDMTHNYFLEFLPLLEGSSGEQLATFGKDYLLQSSSFRR